MGLVQGKNKPCFAEIKEVNRKKVSPEREQQILARVEGTQKIVCSTISGPGRSLYIVEDDGEESKLKGAGGLKRKSRSKLVFYSPMHEEGYSGEQEHTSLGGNLHFGKKKAAPKARNSLLAKGAKMEYRAQRRLHDAGIGFDGHCWGVFLESDRVTPLRDVNGYETGFAESEYNTEFEPLSRALGFKVNERDQLGRRIFQDQLSGEELDRHMDLVRRMGGVKNIMALVAELGRHSSTLGNFLYSQKEDRVLATDADTLADYRGMTPEEKGAQFLRDSVSDTMKRIDELQFSEHSDKVPTILQQAVLQFLRGLFSDSIKGKILEGAVEGLKIQNRVQRVVSLNPSSALANISGQNYLGDLEPELYKMLYILLFQSDLRDAFPAREIDPDIFYGRAKECFGPRI